MAAAIAAAASLSLRLRNRRSQPGETVDLKSLPISIQQTIKQTAAGGEIIRVKREDDASGKWNYEVVD